MYQCQDRKQQRLRGCARHADWDPYLILKAGMILTDWTRCCTEGTCLIDVEWSPCVSEYRGRQSTQFQRWVGRGLSVSTWENKGGNSHSPNFLCQIRNDSTRWSMMTSYYGPWWNNSSKKQTYKYSSPATAQIFVSANAIFDTIFVILVLACIKNLF